MKYKFQPRSTKLSNSHPQSLRRQTSNPPRPYQAGFCPRWRPRRRLSLLVNGTITNMCNTNPSHRRPWRCKDGRWRSGAREGALVLAAGKRQSAPLCTTSGGGQVASSRGPRRPASFAREQRLASLRSPRRRSENSAPRAWPAAVVGKLTRGRRRRWPTSLRGPKQRPTNSAPRAWTATEADELAPHGCGLHRRRLQQATSDPTGTYAPPLYLSPSPLHPNHLEQGCCS